MDSTSSKSGATASAPTTTSEEEQLSKDLGNLPAFVNEWGRKFPSCLLCGRARGADCDSCRDPSVLQRRRALKEICIKSIVPGGISAGGIDDSFPFCESCEESDIGKLSDLFTKMDAIKKELSSVAVPVMKSFIRSYAQSTTRNEEEVYNHQEDENTPGIKVEVDSDSDFELVAVDAMQNEKNAVVAQLSPPHASDSETSSCFTPPASLVDGWGSSDSSSDEDEDFEDFEDVDGCGSSTSTSEEDEDHTPLSQKKNASTCAHEKRSSMHRNSELLSEANLPVIYTSSHSIYQSVKSRRRTGSRNLLMIDRENLMGNIQISKKKKRKPPTDKSGRVNHESLKRTRIPRKVPFKAPPQEKNVAPTPPAKKRGVGRPRKFPRPEAPLKKAGKRPLPQRKKHVHRKGIICPHCPQPKKKKPFECGECGKALWSMESKCTHYRRTGVENPTPKNTSKSPGENDDKTRRQRQINY